MVGVRAGQAEVARYVYDALGRRISTASGTRTVISLHLGNDIIYETDGTTITKYIVAGGRYLAKVVTQAQGAAAQQAAAWETPRSGDIIVRPPVVGQPIPVELPPQEPPLGEEPPAGEPPSGEQPPSPYGVFYFHTDLVGSIRAVTDSTGQVVARYEYEPFGLGATTEGPLAGQDVHKFTGKPEDGETGLYYFGARYYDPEVGRFVAQDPVGDGLNWYEYCTSNPLRYADPTGLYRLEVDRQGRPYAVVEPGDTLSGIVFDLAPNAGWAAVYEVASLNGLSDPDLIQVGAWIRLPNSVVPDITQDLWSRMEAGVNDPRIYWPLYFYDKVRSGGDWDLKANQGTVYYYKHGYKWYLFDGRFVRGDAPGNIMYGYVDAAVFHDFVLFIGAGIAQIQDGTSEPSWRRWPYFGDDPRDQEYIRLGIYLYYRDHPWRADWW